MKEQIGPVQMIVLGFKPNFKFEGKILKEFQKLEDAKTIRIIDLLFVKKEEDGNSLIALNWQGEDLGSIVGALLGFEFEGEEKDPKAKKESVSDGENAFGMSKQELDKIAQSLEPGSAAGFLLIEHVWARDLKKAIRDAGGYPIAEGFLTPEALREVRAEVLAMVNELNKEEDTKESKNEKEDNFKQRRYVH